MHTLESAPSTGERRRYVGVPTPYAVMRLDTITAEAPIDESEVQLFAVVSEKRTTTWAVSGRKSPTLASEASIQSQS
jgi:hypothetical protein